MSHDLIKKSFVSALVGIAIVFILVASFATINYAFGENHITLTPDDVIFQNHSLIIDIDEPNTGPIEITIRSSSGDVVIADVNYDESWGKYRVVISAKNANPNTNDNIIQARNGSNIIIEYGSDPDKWPSITFSSVQSEVSAGDRWTYSEILPVNGCDDNDDDNDGICDDWETGSTLRISDPSINGEYIFDCLPGGGCDNTKKDIFVEIDWIESHKPDPKAIQQVIDAFANARDSNNGLDGIRLHIQVDPNSTYAHFLELEFPGYDLDGYRGFDQLKAESFGILEERNDPNTDWNEIKKLKHQVFHYGIFAHKIVGDDYQTGIGEIVGNDFLITLAKYSGRIGSTDQQSGTLMHELGHNLGLNHGGGEFDEVNNKPNLFSVMTYARQFSDLDSNRKLDFSNATLGHHHTNPARDPAALFKGLHEDRIIGFRNGMAEYPGHENEFIIFSCPDGQVAPLLYLPGRTGGVDWDCDGISTTPGKFALNINSFTNDPNPGGERLYGHNDWNELNFAFSSNAGNYADGRHSKVASGFAKSGGDGIPFGEDVDSLADMGFLPDKGYNFTATGQADLTFEDITLNRISNLLSLYRQIDMFDESDFKTKFSLGSNFWLTTNSTILETQFQSTSEINKDSIEQVAYSIREPSLPKAFAEPTASVSTPEGTSVPGCEETNECFIPYEVTVDVGGEVTWSNDDTAAHTVTAGSAADGPSGVFDSNLFVAGTSFSHTFEEEGEFPYFCMVHPWMTGIVIVGNSEKDEKKDSFKAAVRSAINLINHHEIQKTKIAIQIIDKALKNSLSHNYDKIQPITSNLNQALIEASGFGAIYIDEPEIEPIVEERKIATMIKDVEEFVEYIKTTEPPCGDPYEKVGDECVCPFGYEVDEELYCYKADGPVVAVSETNFMVKYEFTGGNLISITPDVDANSLIIAIDATDDDQLTIILPRELIDAKIGDDDDDYFVLVDGEEVDFDETTTSTDRTLVISFPTGAEEIEIIGTHVVPEFGAIAALILAVGIISIMIFTTKSKVFPRL